MVVVVVDVGSRWLGWGCRWMHVGWNTVGTITSTGPLGSVSVSLEMRVGMNAPMRTRWVSRQRGRVSVVTVAGPSHVGVAWVGC